MVRRYEAYLRKDKLPTQWCAGCGDAIVMQSLCNAIDQLGLDKNDVAVVSGIGCSGRMTTYLDFNTLHTTHGRTIPFAMGIKLVRPDKTVIIVSGDGDALAIGGNHFIHACRRNIDLTMLVVNNFTYGLTGGQFSPSTPGGSWAPTSPYGSIEPIFDIPRVAEAAGATYVARATVANPQHMSDMIKQGIEHKGMAVLELIANCHVNWGRRNKHPDAPELIDWIRKRTITPQIAANMNADELRDKFVIGVLARQQRPEYTQLWAQVVEKGKAHARK